MRIIQKIKPAFTGKVLPFFASFTTKTNAPKKPRLVVLGSGWGAFGLIRDLDRSKFDITMVSPRNHMLFTPLLASTAVGTLEFRSIAGKFKRWTSLPFSTCKALKIIGAFFLVSQSPSVVPFPPSDMKRCDDCSNSLLSLPC